MYAIIPKKNNEWVISIMKEFDVIEMDHNHVRVWWDSDILEILHYPKDTPLLLEDERNAIRLEGLVSWEEAQELKDIPYLYVEKLTHAYRLDAEGFFGESYEGGYDVSSNDYYIVCYLSEHLTEAFLQKEITPYLKDIRLKELFD